MVVMGALLLTGCSQVTDTVLGSVSSPAATESVPATDSSGSNSSDTDSSGSTVSDDPCAIVDSMSQELTNSVGRFIADPTQDAATALQAEFDIQMELLRSLIASVESTTASDQLTSDLDTAVAQKDEALAKLDEALQSGNILEKGVLLGAAAIAAQNSIDSAQRVLNQLSVELQCQ